MTTQRWILVTAVVLGVGYYWLSGGFVGLGSASTPQPSSVAAAGAVEAPVAAAGMPSEAAATTAGAGLAVATFAAGCFWCTEADFDKVEGVISTTSGYTGGTVVNPTYRQVSFGGTGHAEAVEIVYDPSAVSYEALLDHYWRNVDPFVAGRQFCDVGDSYRPAIFVHDAAQRAAAEASKARMQERFAQRIVVAIVDAGPFYRAEEYHQDYYKKNSAQYRFYRFGCGRDARLAQIWGDVS